ncbi:septum site-determining protein Ssd [Mycobacterium hubeiense]|uniref:septum site-determining protein Ssd n=1 Tax=Mycobacterium hubeiense TaxID=1867256 RepID=UPI000C7F579C|nr:septum site-determining protein Ssd [Mycobacterium sp. QGD 101]
MPSTHGVLALIDDPALREDVDRVGAAAGVPVIHAAEPSSRKVWTAAAAVLLDVPAARRCTARALPRRGEVVLVGRAEPRQEEWEAAVAVGAQRVITLPRQDGELVAHLSDAAESTREESRHGTVAAVIGGRGGAGASLFAIALADAAPDALLVDVDPWGGGIDLALGGEADVGLRWPDLAIQGGRLSHSALRAALPSRHGVSVLSCGRSGTEIDAGPLAAVIDAGCRGGATVICDLPRRPGAAVETALETADLVVLVTSADVRSCAAAAVIGAWVSAINPNVGLVVRGPAPSGLRAAEVSDAVGLPVLAAMRPQPRVADMLERDGLRPGRHSPLAKAARQVLAVLQQRPSAERALEV